MPSGAGIACWNESCDASAELQILLLQASKTIQAGARIDCMILEGPFLMAGLSLPASSTSSKAQVPASVRVWDIQTGADSSLGALQVSPVGQQLLEQAA